jgi:hypothetical protein
MDLQDNPAGLLSYPYARRGIAMYMSQAEAKFFEEMIESVTKPLKDRIEKLERQNELLHVTEKMPVSVLLMPTRPEGA